MTELSHLSPHCLLKILGIFQILQCVTSNDKCNGMSLENKRLGSGDYFNFVIIVSFSHPILLTENSANGLVEAPLK